MIAQHIRENIFNAYDNIDSLTNSIRFVFYLLHEKNKQTKKKHYLQKLPAPLHGLILDVEDETVHVFKSSPTTDPKDFLYFPPFLLNILFFH